MDGTGSSQVFSRKLVVHIRKEPYDIFVGRGSYWGNPWSHLPNTRALYKVATRKEAIECYADWIMTQDEMLRKIKYLKGKILGCWCDPLPCHGHVLAALANEDYEYDFGSI